MNQPQLADLARRLADLEARVERMQHDVEDLAALRTEEEAPGPDLKATTAPSGDLDDETSAAPVFATSADWVRAYLLPTFERSYGGEMRWCAQWSTHPEAVLRLEAMWRAWEALLPDDGLGLSVWLLSHFDPSFSVLTSRTGPFARCTTDRHSA